MSYIPPSSSASGSINYFNSNFKNYLYKYGLWIYKTYFFKFLIKFYLKMQIYCMILKGGDRCF